MLLSRVAGRIYWAARYLERAEDTAQLLRAHGEVAADLPPSAPAPWEPLVTVVGSDGHFADLARSLDGPRQSQSQSQGNGRQQQSMPATRELAVARFLVADRTNPGSIASAVAAARENLRTTRDTVPRDGWHALNDLNLYVASEADRAIDRRMRDRFLYRVVADSRRIDGILATAMTHDEAYVMWRLGRAIERADMTTRVLGVRAAAVLAVQDGDASIDVHDELQWMGVLKSLSGLQMYQRAMRGPIEGPRVVAFLLDDDRFPRAVRALLREIRSALGGLPGAVSCLDGVDHVAAVLRRSTDASASGAALDDAMDALQAAIGELSERISDRYLRVGT